MDDFDKLMEELQGSELQNFGDWSEVINYELYEKWFETNDHKVVAEGLYVSTHRWYETSTTVVEIFGRFIGFNMVTNLFSEMMDNDDTGASPTIFEMEQVPSVTYITKKKV